MLAANKEKREADSAAAPEEEEELDWRLQGPTVKKAAPVFKPGTSTWDTDDAFEQKRKAPKLDDDEKPKPLPQYKGIKPAAWWMQEYRPVYEETVQTVGHAARAMTSTIAPVHTKNERVMKLKHRCPSTPHCILNAAYTTMRRFCTTCSNGKVLCGHILALLLHAPCRACFLIKCAGRQGHAE
jgi:hypothetical protein